MTSKEYTELRDFRNTIKDLGEKALGLVKRVHLTLLHDLDQMLTEYEKLHPIAPEVNLYMHRPIVIVDALRLSVI